MKKATPGNKYVYLQKTEQVEILEKRKNNHRNRSLCEHLKTKISNFDEFKFWNEPKKIVKTETYGFWHNVKYHKKLKEYVASGFKVTLSGWANNFGTIVIDM